MANSQMKIFQDSLIGKARSPEETVQWVLSRFRAMENPIFSHFYAVNHPSGIPQFRVVGTSLFPDIKLGVPSSGTNGKGHTKLQALASGLVELAERYSCFKYLRDENNFQVLSYQNLPDNPYQLDYMHANVPPELGEFDIWQEHLKQLPMQWYRGVSVDGQSVFLPLIYHWYAGCSSNGMGAGNHFTEALIHAVCEIIERDCVFRIMYQQLPTPLIARESINSPKLLALLNRFDQLGQKVEIRDFSLDYGIPVFGVLRWNQFGEVTVTAGVATEKKEALARAVTENSQGESDPRNNISPEKLGLLMPLSDEDVVDFSGVVDIADEDYAVELQTVIAVLDQVGKKLFYVDMTDDELQIPSLMAFVPGAYSQDGFHRQPYDSQHIAPTVFHIASRIAVEMNAYEQLSAMLDTFEGYPLEKDVWYFLRKAALAFHHDDWDGYRQSLEKALSKEESNAAIVLYVTYQLSLCDFKAGDMKDAVAKLWHLFRHDFRAKTGVRSGGFLLPKRFSPANQRPKSFRILEELVEFFSQTEANLHLDKIMRHYGTINKTYPVIRDLYTRLIRAQDACQFESCLKLIESLRDIDSILYDILNLQEKKLDVLLALGRKAEAVEVAERMLSMDPENPVLLNLLAFLYKDFTAIT